MISDKELISIYLKGFKDELRGIYYNSYKSMIERKAYYHGKLDAIVGDEIGSVDCQSESEILKSIKSKL